MGKTIDLTGQRFNYLTVLRKTNEKKGTSYLWECRCDCGNITKANSAELKAGHKKSCGCLHTIQRSNLGKSKGINLLGQKFGNLVVIEKTDKREDGRIIWKCQCDCGNIIEVRSSYLLQNKKTHCGCQTNISNGEKLIISLLQKEGINFEKEKTFSDLLHNNKKLRYDFYVNNSYLIEYDGKQHYVYDSTGYGKELLEIQKRDSLKNKYALNNNIPLIRIPYTHYDKLCIEDLLLKTSKFIIKEV